MAKKPGRTTEREIGEAVLQILAKSPKGEATVAELVKELPKHIKLSSGDQAGSKTRTNEELWEQQVRNLKSHDTLAKAGFVEHPQKNVWRITAAGRLHVQSGSA
jgi:hypothetical protein